MLATHWASYNNNNNNDDHDDKNDDDDDDDNDDRCNHFNNRPYQKMEIGRFKIHRIYHSLHESDLDQTSYSKE